MARNSLHAPPVSPSSLLAPIQLNNAIAKFADFALLLLASLLASAAIASAEAGVLRLSDTPAGSIGLHADYLVEGDIPLSLPEAAEKQRSGDFRPETNAVPNFGIGSRPVWLHLAIENDTLSDAERIFVGGVTWLDRLDVYVVHPDGSLDQSHTGDEIPNAPGLTPAIGYALPLHFPPGRNDIYLRIASADPMPVPIELTTQKQLEERRLRLGYFYGLFFGFLAALSAYNLLLFAGTKERSYLYYALTLGSILFCNFAYTGHGVNWLWPDSPTFQRYVILVSMVAYNAMGLMFAVRFLALAEHAPRSLTAIRWLGGLGLSAMSLAVMMDSQSLAALIAFVCMGAFSIGMFLLGILSVHREQVSGRHFLFATFFGMLGVASTAFAVWGKIPFTLATFHASEAGLMIEATLLALALANWMRQHQHARHHAELVARQDALTLLNNRRAFMEFAVPYMDTAERHKRPMSLIMMDIDHFKSINDQYGHKTGDLVLVAVADLLKKHCRTGDIVARWGGEEFILLLPETDAKQAFNHAERLRQAITEIHIPAGEKTISLTASFGIAERAADLSLDRIIEQADVQLYKAKGSGRNRVCRDDDGLFFARPCEAKI